MAYGLFKTAGGEQIICKIQDELVEDDGSAYMIITDACEIAPTYVDGYRLHAFIPWFVDSLRENRPVVVNQTLVTALTTPTSKVCENYETFLASYRADEQNIDSLDSDQQFDYTDSDDNKIILFPGPESIQ